MKNQSSLKRILLMFISFCLLSGCATNPEQYKPNPQLSTSSSVMDANKAAKQFPLSKTELGLLKDLLGSWTVQDWQLRKDGQWQPLYGARWDFRAIQNGRALQDAWTSFAQDGQSVSGHVNALRVFDPSSGKWQAAWLSSNEGRLDNYSGIQSGGEVVFTATQVNKGRLSRQIFSNITAQSFAWRIEWSKDNGQSWLPVYRVQAVRR